MRQRRKSRVHGPYAHGKQWRLVVVSETGARDYPTFGSEEEALEVMTALRAEWGPGTPGTVGDLIDRYEGWLRDRGRRASTIGTTTMRLRRFFGSLTARDARQVTAARCQERYEALCGELAAATHQNILGEARTFAAWALKRKWIRRDPVREIESVGRANEGKPQLRLDEARAFTACALELADAGNDAGVAVLCALVLGMRASEVVGRLVEDVDDGGRLLWIPQSKTAAGRRTLVVPAFMRGRLVQLAEGRKPQESLFRSANREWISDWSERICTLAGVRRVTTHGLRGTHATLAVEGGTSPADVARTLGHADESIVVGVYAKPGSGKAAGAERLLRVLKGGVG
jgi:integrase